MNQVRELAVNQMSQGNVQVKKRWRGEKAFFSLDNYHDLSNNFNKYWVRISDLLMPLLMPLPMTMLIKFFIRHEISYKSGFIRLHVL